MRYPRLCRPGQTNRPGLLRHLDEDFAPLAAVQRARAALRGGVWFGARLALAAVWLYQGLLCKLLLARPAHAAVLEEVPGLGAHASLALPIIGVIETALAAWILSARRPLLAAAAQTLLLVAMNAGGLLFAADAIHDLAGMLLQNLAFLLLAWIVALHAPRDLHERSHT